jgi:hypothetical protein
METFIWSIVFGIIGMGYFSFGKKQDNAVFLLFGIALMLFPYIIDGLVKTITIGIMLGVLPFVVVKYLG